jgi:hypothetical protein
MHALLDVSQLKMVFNGRRRRRADKVNDVKRATNNANYEQTEQTF